MARLLTLKERRLAGLELEPGTEPVAIAAAILLPLALFYFLMRPPHPLEPTP